MPHAGSNADEHHGDGAGSGSGAVVIEPPPPPHRSRVAPYTVIGIGGAAVVGGAIALAFDDPSKTSPRGQEQRAEYRDTTVPGLVAIGAGAVVVGIGVYWLLHVPKPATTATLAPTSGGAVVGVSRSF
jgi:hypothetical protein